MQETEKMFELTQKTYELVEGIFGSYSNLNKLYENTIKDYDEQNSRIKEVFENTQKNLSEIQKIRESNIEETNKIEAILKDQSLISESVKGIQKSIDDFNTQILADEKDISSIKTEILTKKEEILDSINKKIEEIENQKNQIQKLIEDSNHAVSIEGSEVTVEHNGNIVHYKFEDGTALEGVDFINEKADNGVDHIIEKVDKISVLQVGESIGLSNNHQNKSVSHFTLGDGITMGIYDDEQNQNSISINPNATVFSNDIFVGEKKVLLEGDQNLEALSSLSVLDFRKKLKTCPIPDEIIDQKEYLFFSPFLWERKSLAKNYSITMFNPLFSISATDLGDGIDESGTLPPEEIQRLSRTYQTRHSLHMGNAGMGISISSTMAEEAYGRGISIFHEKERSNTSSVLIEETIDIASVSSNSDGGQGEISSISISPHSIAMNSNSFTFNGREVLLNR